MRPGVPGLGPCATTLVCVALLGALLVPTGRAAGDERKWESYDHFRTRFPLVGAHERVDCESCHRDGEFEGTPTRCVLCHDGAGFRAQTAKSVDHIISTNDCDDCHLMNAWVPSRVDHAAVRGSCFSCHNGVTASGKNPGHVTSGNECELCHDTHRWTGARYDHFGITARCVSCHNNIDRPGKPNDHPVSSDDCEDCHNTRNWEDAHYDHSNVTEPCSNCHADDLPRDHFVTSEECDACHRTTRWSPDTFSHSTPDYPGRHAGDPACVACHSGNSETVVYPRPEFEPDCAACHASDFGRERHRNRRTGSDYTVSELRDCTIACHVEDDGRPEHRVGDSAW